MPLIWDHCPVKVMHCIQRGQPGGQYSHSMNTTLVHSLTLLRVESSKQICENIHIISLMDGGKKVTD